MNERPPLKFSRRMVMIDQDEYDRVKRKTNTAPPVGHVANPDLRVVKNDVTSLARVRDSLDDPAIKAESYGRLINKYFEDLGRVGESQKRAMPKHEDRGRSRLRERWVPREADTERQRTGAAGGDRAAPAVRQSSVETIRRRDRSETPAKKKKKAKV